MPHPTRNVSKEFVNLLTAATLMNMSKKGQPKTTKNIAKEFTHIMQKIQNQNRRR